MSLDKRVHIVTTHIGTSASWLFSNPECSVSPLEMSKSQVTRYDIRIYTYIWEGGRHLKPCYEDSSIFQRAVSIHLYLENTKYFRNLVIHESLEIELADSFIRCDVHSFKNFKFIMQMLFVRDIISADVKVGRWSSS